MGALCNALGCLLSAITMDRFGRKKILLTMNVPSLIGWILIACAKDVPTIYVGRVFTGLGGGMSSAPGAVYAAETSQAKFRGMLTCWNSGAVGLGILLVYILGTFLHWNIVAGVSCIIPILALILIVLLPESPHWLIGKGRAEHAKKSLHWLRCGSSCVSEELKNMVQHQQQNRRQVSGTKEMLAVFLTARGFRPLLIMNTIFLVQQFAGGFVVVFYAVKVIQQAGSDLNNFLGAIIIGIVRFLVILSLSVTLMKFGRKPLMVVSGIGMSVSMFILGTCLYFDNLNIAWLLLIAIFVYVIMASTGFLTIPWILNGEIYPLEIRGLASCCTTSVAHLLSFVAIKMFPSMLEHVGSYGVFWLYAAIAAVGTIFVVIFLPETKGKTLDEIESFFQKSKKIPSEVNLEEIRQLS